MDELVQKMEKWLGAERFLKDADPEMRAAAEQCRTRANDWCKIREKLRVASMQDHEAPMPTGLAWIALESLNGYHLSLHVLLMKIVARSK
jgi:hypothetical protein